MTLADREIEQIIRERDTFRDQLDTATVEPGEFPGWREAVS
jgi:hypothetical protein